MTVESTLMELSAQGLRAAAAKTAGAKAAGWMLAIVLVLEGMDRGTAAATFGTDRQTLCDWVHRCNAERLDGLSNRRSAGPTPRLCGCLWMPQVKPDAAARTVSLDDRRRIIRCRR
ncbi:helix-turn-helix domain-containing protein [Roseovarius sp.]|uniref:helix-turn-helix domain-containing protein n=1 Tax=Roseovarius sp. TaxID=1486281 RepID=UPI0035614119